MRDTTRRGQVRRLLERREREGLTYRELAEISGESAGTLAWWASRLRAEDSGGFVELVAEERSSVGGERVELVLSRSGHRVVVPEGFDGDSLSRLIEVLERPAC